MTLMRSGPWSAPLVRMALAALLFSVLSPFLAPPAAQAQAERQTLLVFAPEDVSGTAPSALSGELTDAAMRAMRRGMLFAPVLYSVVDPSVERAVDEGRLSPDDVRPQVTGPAAIAIGQAIGADAVLLTKIEGYSATADPAAVNLTLSGVVYDVGENWDARTLAPKAELTGGRAFAVQGMSTPRVGYDGDLAPLRAEAVEDAIAKAREALTGLPSTPTAPVVSKKKIIPEWALWLVGAGILVALLNSNDDGGGGAGDLPQNTRLSSDGTSVLLQWDPPAQPRSEIQAYRIYRKAGSETSFSQITQVGGAQITYTDFSVEGGVSYTYQISIVYQTTGETQRVTFQTITVPSAQT